MKRKLIICLIILVIGTIGISCAYTWPTVITNPKVNSVYGMRNGKMHKGIDIPAQQGAPCYAVASGKIISAGTYGDGSFGKMVILDIGDHVVAYAHLSQINVNVGQQVAEKTVVGLVGNTGRSTGPHLHFEVRKGNPSNYGEYCGLSTTVDPQTFLNGASTTSGTTATHDLSQRSRLFSDLPNGHWAENDVKELKQLGIINGRGDGTLGTEDSITAEEFIVMLSKMLTKKGVSTVKGRSTTPYVPAGMSNKDWSYDEFINLAKLIGCNPSTSRNPNSGLAGQLEIKMILGNDDKTVMSNYKKPISREKVFYLLGIFLKDYNASSVNEFSFKDWSKVADLYKKSINALAKKNIVRGDGALNVKPKDSLKRSEAIALVNRLYKEL